MFSIYGLLELMDTDEQLLRTKQNFLHVFLTTIYRENSCEEVLHMCSSYLQYP